MRAPLRIVHVVLGLDVGGLERVVLRLLAHTDRQRWSPSVVALDAPGALAGELVRLGVPMRVMGRGPGLDHHLVFRLSAFLQREHACLVHTHNASPHLYGALAAHFSWWGPRPRIVHTKHGRNQPDHRRRVLINRFASAISDRVVAVSEDAARVAVDVERVRPEKVLTILNGVDTGEFRPRAAAAARAALGIPPDGFHVGCVARLAPIKDHRTLLAAFARLRAAIPGAHLTLIGDGSERAALEAFSAELGLAQGVTFAGERAEVAPLLPAFDVFALSSKSEGISLTLLEAAAAGLPVVATRVGGNAEVVVDGCTGLLVPAGDPEAFASALTSLATREDRMAMGAAGRARVARAFSVERMARDYEALYEEVLRAA